MSRKTSVKIPNRKYIINTIEGLLVRKIQNGTVQDIGQEIQFLSGAMQSIQAILSNDDDDSLNAIIPPRWWFNAIRSESLYCQRLKAGSIKGSPLQADYGCNCDVCYSKYTRECKECGYNELNPDWNDLCNDCNEWNGWIDPKHGDTSDE